ncbi:unnamed protein product [Sphagnum tenellum]
MQNVSQRTKRGRSSRSPKASALCNPLLPTPRTGGEAGRRATAEGVRLKAAMTRTTVVSTTENATGATSSASKVRLTAFAPATSNERLRSCMHPGSVAQRSH